MCYFVAAVFGTAYEYGFCIKATKRGMQVFQNFLNGIGSRKLNATILLVSNDCLFRCLTNGYTIFFLVHWSYLLDFVEASRVT